MNSQTTRYYPLALLTSLSTAPIPHGLVTLSLTGYRIVTACDFTEGLRLARQRYFDLYIFISPNQVLPTLLSGRLRAEEKALRAKANLAFLAAKGTRGDFARLWPSVYLREVRD